ncbi:MAG: hypothetical protein IK083_02490 [Abditibacteriota bacterium]|nr:hypothetical protein [Abditibacteriota bacterium]
MKKLISVLAVLLLATTAFALNCYEMAYSVDGKRYTQTISATTSQNARKLIEQRYAGHKVNIISVRSVSKTNPKPEAAKTTASQPLWTVTFSMDGRKYQQAYYARTAMEAKRQVVNIYKGHKVTIYSVKRK